MPMPEARMPSTSHCSAPDRRLSRADAANYANEFLEFLDRLRVLTPHQGTATRPPTTGDRFLL